MPLISVIVTCYNVAEYLEACLESVVNQTLRDMEIIVVDDGSTDGTQDIIRKYERSDPRVQAIVFSENTIGGVGSAANAGLDAATGKFVGFVDGDDYLEPEMFEKMCHAASTNDSDLAMCKYLKVDETTGKAREPAERGRWAGLSDTQYLRLDSPDQVIEILGFIAVPWRKIYTQALLEEYKIRFPVVDYPWEDNPFHWYTVCAARSISLVHEVLCYHRVGRGGQTMKARSPGFVKIFGHHQTIRDWLSQRSILDRYEGALLSWAVAQYEWVVARIPQESGEALYEALRPVVLSADEALLDKALRAKLRSTGRMLRWVRAGERELFLENFQRRFTGETSASREVGARVERGLVMIGLARENLRTYGIRNTLDKILIRAGLGPRFGSPKGRWKERAITESEVVKLLEVLQRDNDRKYEELHERLRDLERRSGDGGSERDP